MYSTTRMSFIRFEFLQCWNTYFMAALTIGLRVHSDCAQLYEIYMSISVLRITLEL